jgi:hypothetical protein
MKKPIDPDDSYIVREMFGCGEGHVWTPGYTHWEAGEGCPFGHSDEATNEELHLYRRLVMVPTKTMGGTDLWQFILEHPNEAMHFPMAPEGLAEGTRVGTKEKVKEEE